MAHYYACKFGLNRLRIDGDIRQKAAITAIMANVVIAIYRLRPIQLSATFSVSVLGHHVPSVKTRCRQTAVKLTESEVEWWHSSA